MTEPKKLDILVIENTKNHQESAREHFKDHTLTLAQNYLEGKKKILERDYSVVLTDLMMPYGGMEVMGAEGTKYIFDAAPFGFPLAFLAAKKGTQYVGIVTDVNHHNHPISAALDPIVNESYNLRTNCWGLDRISNLRIFHAPFTADGRKDWQKVLKELHNTKI